MSKIVTVTLGSPAGRPSREGWLILSYADPRGGRTSIGTIIKRPRWTEVTDDGQREREGPFPTWEKVAADLGVQIGAQPSWPKFVKAKSSGNTIKLSVPDELDPTVFFVEFNPSLTQEAAHELSPDFATVGEERF